MSDDDEEMRGGGASFSGDEQDRLGQGGEPGFEEVEHCAESGVERVGNWLDLLAPSRLPEAEECEMQIDRAIIVDRLPGALIPGTETDGLGFLTAVHELELEMADEGGRATAKSTVLLFGCTGSGRPMLLRINDFRPYIYFEYPRNKQAFQRELAQFLRLEVGELEFKSVQRRNMYGWVPNARENPSSRKSFPYLQVFFPNVALMRRAAKAPVARFGRVHEDRVSVETKFLDDQGLRPSGWVKVEHARPVVEGRIFHPGANGSLELECKKNNLVPLPDRADIAPLLVAFVDIECISHRMAFPDAAIPEDEVCQIGVTFWRVGSPIETAINVLFVQPARCGVVDNAFVERFDTESELLCGFRKRAIVDANPCVLATYNGFGFDLPYLWKRAELKCCDEFAFFDRIASRRCETHRKELSSSALGQNDLFLVDMFGRMNLDLYHWIKAREKLDSYKLDAVAEAFLGEHKIEMDYKRLFCMARGTPAEIARVGVYCMQDCFLLVQLSVRLQIFAGNVEMSRVCCTPMELLVTRGQQIKVVNQLVWYGHRMERDADGENGYIMNTPVTFSGGPDDTYMGATVIDAQAKYYTEPIATLDFMSLYPSIILANNFCFSTLVQAKEYEDLPGVEYAEIVMEEKRYVWAKNHPGVIPEMMKALLGARKEAKRLMADAGRATKAAEMILATCPTDASATQARDAAKVSYAVFNARQSALKISANSIYGFTGAVKTGQYHCLAIADSVTYRARQMLNQTVAYVKEFTCDGCDVVYGDTDSVMVRFHGADTVQLAAEKATAAADWITGRFQEMTGTTDIVLEFEKVYFPYLLMRKKRYAGLMFEPDKDGVMHMTKLDAKGIELVRRDNCAIAKSIQKKTLDALMYKRDPDLAQSLIAEELDRIVKDEVPVTDYKISKSRRKDYKNDDLPHLRVCKKMYDRQPGSEPQVGDRVPFVFLYLKNNPKAKAFEKAEDIGYVLRNPDSCKLDRLYYLEHQIENSVCSLLELVVPNPSRLFDNARRELTHQQTGQRSIFTMLGGAGSTRSAGPSLEDTMFDMAPAASAQAQKKPRRQTPLGKKKK